MSWWRVFKGEKGAASEETPIGHRRRQHARVVHRAPVKARCRSWSKLVEVLTEDLSEGGLFVPTKEEAELGEPIDVELSLPDGQRLLMRGQVVAIVNEEQAARHGKKPGLGIKLGPLPDEAFARFEMLLAAAREGLPALPSKPKLAPVPPSEAVSEEAAPPEPKLVSPEQREEPPPARPVAKAKPSPMPAIRPPPRPGEAGQAEGRGTAAAEARAQTPAAAPAASEAAKPPRAARRVRRVDPIVGIDLGTTYTSVGAVIERRVTILPDEHGNTTTPSVIAFPQPGEILVGKDARERLVHDPKHTVMSPKRLLGRQFDDEDVQRLLARAEYKAKSGPDGTVVLEMWNEPYAVPQLCGYLLRRAREIAEANLQQTVHRAVVAVPVTFKEPQLDALRRAGRLAQLDIVDVIDEPTAAAMANRNAPSFGGVIAIYDFGGGTFDISVVDVSAGDFRVLVTGGDGWLGGDDFDAALCDAVANQLWRMYRVEVRERAVELQKLAFACERTKRVLSTADEAVLRVPELLRTPSGMLDLTTKVTRNTFQQLAAPVIGRSLTTVREALLWAELDPSRLSTVFLSGGTSYIPAIRRALIDEFRVPVLAGVPPEHAACIGATIQAATVQMRVG